MWIARWLTLMFILLSNYAIKLMILEKHGLADHYFLTPITNDLLTVCVPLTSSHGYSHLFYFPLVSLGIKDSPPASMKTT